ncbi:MAG TPA: hypothetical protein VJH34_00285 [archaeon]|nr:hypothetical protein [archaeon]
MEELRKERILDKYPVLDGVVGLTGIYLIGTFSLAYRYSKRVRNFLGADESENITDIAMVTIIPNFMMFGVSFYSHLKTGHTIVPYGSVIITALFGSNMAYFLSRPVVELGHLTHDIYKRRMARENRI